MRKSAIQHLGLLALRVPCQCVCICWAVSCDALFCQLPDIDVVVSSPITSLKRDILPTRVKPNIDLDICMVHRNMNVPGISVLYVQCCYRAAGGEGGGGLLAFAVE